TPPDTRRKAKEEGNLIGQPSEIKMWFRRSNGSYSFFSGANQTRFCCALESTKPFGLSSPRLARFTHHNREIKNEFVDRESKFDNARTRFPHLTSYRILITCR